MGSSPWIRSQRTPLELRASAAPGKIVDNYVHNLPVDIAAAGIRGMVMRGGTSKGLYFVTQDLPADPTTRDELLLRFMGTPDARQIDGLGGAHPLTSKVAVVGPAQDGRSDVEYLFLQVGVEEPSVSDRQNCGNLLAGVGPFAVERGLVDVADGDVTIGIHMLNTDSRATATFRVEGGAPVYSGDTAISGVPGLAAPIRLDFEGLAGSTTGALFPSGSAVDVVNEVECTLIDNGMPVAVLRAGDLGITGYESCYDLESNDLLRERLERIRLAAAPLMNLGDVTSATVPKMTMVAAPTAGGSLSTRTFIPHRCHQAIGVLGAVSVATAAVYPGTIASDLVGKMSNGVVVLEHPTGTFEAVVEVDGAEVTRAGIVRTARKLMDGTVFPRSY